MELVASQAHACIIAMAGDPCLYPGEHLKDRLKPHVAPRDPKRRDGFGTWLAQGAEWITVGRYGNATLVYLPSQDAFYQASPAAMLSPQCPDKTVFVGQFIVEPENTPRVLVHDLLRLQGVSFIDMPPRERYACLQQMANHLGPGCTLQWAGECKVLADELRSGRFKVPHAVKAVVAFTGVPGRTAEAD